MTWCEWHTHPNKTLDYYRRVIQHKLCPGTEFLVQTPMGNVYSMNKLDNGMSHALSRKNRMACDFYQATQNRIQPKMYEFFTSEISHSIFPDSSRHGVTETMETETKDEWGLWHLQSIKNGSEKSPAKNFICTLEFRNKNHVDTALGSWGIIRKLNSSSTSLSDLTSWFPLPIKTTLVCALLFWHPFWDFWPKLSCSGEGLCLT